MSTRRSFLKSAVASSALLSVPAFAAAPVPTKWDKTVDVVVIGFGGAGANSAISAKENGADVLIIEKMEQPGGNTSVSSGNFLYCKDPEKVRKYFRRLFDRSRCELDEELLKAYTDKMTQTVDWMKHLDPNANIRVVNRSSFPHIKDSESVYACTVMDPEGTTNHAGGGPNLFALYKKAVEDHGIPVMLATPAKNLIIKDGEILGVRAEHEGKPINIKANKGVVLACGGYEYDDKSLQNYNLGNPILKLGCPGNTGDGLRMAQAAGAELWHTSGLSCPLGTPVPGHTPAQAFNTKQIGYILVDQNGKRFINEKSIEHHAGILAVNYFDSYDMKYPRIPCFAIFDANSKEFGAFAPTYGSGWLRHRDKWTWSRNNDKEIELGIVKVGDTVEDLAKKINVPPEELRKTIDQWNKDIKSPEGKDTVWGRVVNGKVMGQTWPYTDRPTKQAAPLDKGPYYAVPLYPAILNTQGGPRHNAKGQVLDPYGNPIPRLYVAGELGSLWGFIYQGCGNNAESLIFGRLAGENVAKEKPWS